jgi:hypothetical protein
MGKPQRFGDLDLAYDPVHEEREWCVQRIGWALIGLAILAAIIGVLGPGPLSKKREGKMGAALFVEYQRFARYQAPGEFKVLCRPEGKEQFRLSLDRTFIEQTEIKEISPEPFETSAAGDTYVYFFKLGQGEEQLVTIRFESKRFGRVNSRVTLDEKETVEVRQFYWP